MVIDKSIKYNSRVLVYHAVRGVVKDNMKQYDLKGRVIESINNKIN